jgi:pyruvate,water dikinase
LAADFCVPPGFCVTSAVYKVTPGEGITYERPEVSSTLRGEVAAAYAELATLCGTDEPPVAVRSSGVGEDSSSAAFAGVHETYLNVRGPLQVMQSIAQCWASAYSPTALHYRSRQAIEDEPIRIAVVVQQMIPAEVSAVVFSANPVTGSRDEVMINASWGLGESIVGGTVTPDTYVVRKPGVIVLREVADKECMAVLAEEGTREVAVPARLRQVPSLTDEQIVEMAQLAEDLEKVMGWPVDIECAYHQAQLYLLQCRPITTLK